MKKVLEVPRLPGRHPSAPHHRRVPAPSRRPAQVLRPRQAQGPAAHGQRVQSAAGPHEEHGGAQAHPRAHAQAWTTSTSRARGSSTRRACSRSCCAPAARLSTGRCCVRRRPRRRPPPLPPCAQRAPSPGRAARRAARPGGWDGPDVRPHPVTTRAQNNKGTYKLVQHARGQGRGPHQPGHQLHRVARALPDDVQAAAAHAQRRVPGRASRRGPATAARGIRAGLLSPARPRAALPGARAARAARSGVGRPAPFPAG